MKKYLSVLIFATSFFLIGVTQAQNAAQKSNINLAQNLAATNNSFATDLKEFGLLEMLEGKGPFTIFAPSNELCKSAPEFTGAEKINYLKSFIVAQNITSKELATQFKMNNNQIQLTTLSGNIISLTKEGDKVMVNSGSQATTIVSTAPEASSNGIIMQLEQNK